MYICIAGIYRKPAALKYQCRPDIQKYFSYQHSVFLEAERTMHIKLLHTLNNFSIPPKTHHMQILNIHRRWHEDESCPWLVFHRGHIVNVIRLTNAYLISTGQFNIIDQKTRNINQMSLRNSFTEMFKLNIFWFCRRLLLGPVTMRILVPVMFVCASLILWREREHLQWSRSV